MGKILEKLMKKYWKNAKNTGKVYEKILEKCKKKTGKVREIRQSKKVGTMKMSFSTCKILFLYHKLRMFYLNNYLFSQLCFKENTRAQIHANCLHKN